MPTGPPPAPEHLQTSATSTRHGPRSRRVERLGLVVSLVSAGAFAGLVGVAAAEERCRDVVEQWSSGDEHVIASTCDDGSPAPSDDEQPPAPADPDAIEV